MNTSIRTVGIAVTTSLLLSVGVHASQPASVEWVHADGVGAADKNAILRLARRLGIDEPRRITFGAYLPSLCPFVRVESDVVVDGNTRTWREVMLRRRDWRECIRVPRFSKRTEGRWIGSRAELTTEESWRIVDGNWFVDVRLGPDVPFEDAQQIVLAVRNGALVNRLPSSIGPLKLDTTMPPINADEIFSIKKAGSALRRYEVRTGQATGEVLDIRVQNGMVELHGVAVWMVDMINGLTPRRWT